MDRPDAFVGTNVFVLFDTSNFMYRGFVYAEDAIADFVRGLDRADSVAVYTFSRNLSRAASLTREHGDAISGLRKSVAGDDTALYNALLLTLRDAAKVPGRKVVIVFSNGPDNASMVAPDDVRAVAEDEGIPIYVISTNEVNKDPISSSVFRRMAQRTGGKAYWAQDLAEAGGGVRGHPRGSGQLLHRDLLSGAQSQRGIPQDHGRDRQRPGQEAARAMRGRDTGRAGSGYKKRSDRYVSRLRLMKRRDLLWADVGILTSEPTPVAQPATAMKFSWLRNRYSTGRLRAPW